MGITRPHRLSSKLKRSYTGTVRRSLYSECGGSFGAGYHRADGLSFDEVD